MRTIVVSKFGNEPNLFGDDLRFGMLGEWECTKLLKILSEDTDNYVIYYGKAKWNQEKAIEYFGKFKVQYIESGINDDAELLSRMSKIDEFHIVLGPHAFYNAGKDIPSWESIKETLVTQRLLDRVSPQIKLINANPQAKCYFYLSDRRFLLQAADITNKNIEVLAQSITNKYYTRPSISGKDYSLVSTLREKVQPFRFETLWLHDRDYVDCVQNHRKSSYITSLAIPANQVVSDEEIDKSRLSKIIDYTDYIKDFTIVGKWTSIKAERTLRSLTDKPQYLYGLNYTDYQKFLHDSKYALIIFNTDDGPELFYDNWITVKYWECVYNGCLTFVEGKKDSNLSKILYKDFIVENGQQLKEVIDKCNSDPKYKSLLIEKQLNLVLPEYFSGDYFKNFINERRTKSNDNK